MASLELTLRGLKYVRVSRTQSLGGLAVEMFKDMSLVVLEFLVVYVCGVGAGRGEKLE